MRGRTRNVALFSTLPDKTMSIAMIHFGERFYFLPDKTMSIAMIHFGERFYFKCLVRPALPGVHRWWDTLRELSYSRREDKELTRSYAEEHGEVDNVFW